MPPVPVTVKVAEVESGAIWLMTTMAFGAPSGALVLLGAIGESTHAVVPSTRSAARSLLECRVMRSTVVKEVSVRAHCKARHIPRRRRLATATQIVAVERFGGLSDNAVNAGVP